MRFSLSTGASETAEQLPGTQTPYQRDHRRTRSRAARWNAGTWPMADRGGVWVCGTRLPASIIGRGCVSSLWWRSQTAHCCLLARGRMSGVRSWSVHDSPCPLGTQRQRQLLLVEIFETTDYPPGPPLGEGEMHLPSPEAVPSLSGSPVPRPLAPLRGGAAYLHLSQRHCFWRLLRMRCGSRGGCRGIPQRNVLPFNDIPTTKSNLLLTCSLMTCLF